MNETSKWTTTRGHRFWIAWALTLTGVAVGGAAASSVNASAVQRGAARSAGVGPASVAESTSAARPEAAVRQASVAAFDGDRALAHARAMVQFGPRPLGSEALEQTRQYIEQQLRQVGWQPQRDEFVANTPIGSVPMANLIARLPDAPPQGKVLVFAGHYDTKKFDAVRFVGANDGASSAAILLELARVLAGHPQPVPVWLVFFDGEEAVVRWSDEDSTYGSRHLAESWRQRGVLDRIGALVLFDMIGDADLRVLRETNSTPWLTDAIWNAARRIGHGKQFPDETLAILDDHLPFLDAGVAATDLIDFSYGPGNRYWHSPFDTLDHLSADSFTVVGQAALAAIPAIAEHLR